MLLYDLGILLYRQGIRIASHTSNVKARALNAGLDNTFSILAEKRDPADRYIWIHAASLGEFE
ncbi:MAG: 3-deoxy-D-manno-octulosonic acid transferase, partial [Muribaculaceae bacterium]|nr:3-deoxy-D-manno-octulosonic acid transferase [Muribaculaceae bacterium]